MKINFTNLKWENLLAVLCMLVVIGLVGCDDDDSVLSGKTDLSVFSLADVDRTFTIDATTGAITNEDALPYGYDVSSLVATFSFAEKATVTIGDVEQVSGETANDFTSPVTYTVTAEDGVTSASFVVTVNVATSAWSKVAEDAFISLTRPSAFVQDDKLWLVGAVNVGESTVFPPTAGTYFEYVYSSSDGVTWDIQHNNTTDAKDSIPLGTEAGTIGYDGKIINVGGFSGSPALGEFDFFLNKTQLGVSVSSDGGASWATTDVTEEGVPSVVNARLLENDGDLFIVGAQGVSFGSAQSINSMDIYKSTNGTTWEAIGTDVLAGLTVADAAPPTYYATALFKGDMYIAGGIAGAAFVSGNLASYAKSAYKSSDGVTWTVATAEGFPQLIGAQMVTYKDKLYAICGVTALQDDGTEEQVDYKRDIYVSEDGATWTLVEGGLALPAEFAGRAFHNAVVLGDKIYIIGGENAEGNVNDVWVGEFVD